MNESIYVYQLVEPGETLAHETGLGAEVFGVDPSEPSRRRFRMSPVSGCFSFSDVERLHADPRPARLPGDVRDARQAAEQALLEANERWGGYRKRRRLDAQALPDLAPLRFLRPFGTELIRRPGARSPHHYLVRWLLHLATSPKLHRRGGRSVPVIGGIVEARIGPAGRLLALRSRVRSWRAAELVEAYAPVKAHEDHGPEDPPEGHEHEAPAEHDHSGHPAGLHPEENEPSGAPVLIYRLEGTEEPQRYVAPYYRVAPSASAGHHHGPNYLPASRFSVVLDLSVHPGSAGTRFSAFTMGRDGKMVQARAADGWSVSWFVSRIEHLDEQTSSGDDLFLRDPGVFHIEVVVEHRQTNAIRATYREIPVGLEPRENESEGPDG